MNRAHVIRLNPTPEQAVYFREACGVARHAYNWALARWKAYRAEGKRARMKDLKREYNAIKGEQFPWCYEVTKCAPEQEEAMDDNDMRHYVYTLAYPDGRVFYVGKGVGDRIDYHESEVRAGRTTNPYKENVIRRIWAEGGQVVKTKLARFHTHEEAVEYEIALIFLMDGLTNLTAGGDGQAGVTFSEEHRRKLSEAQKGKPRKPLPPEARQRVTQANRGRRRSEETRRRMSEARIGKPLAEGAKEKIRLFNTGRSPTEETRRKLSEAHKGRVVSEEERQRIGERYRGKHLSEEHRRKLSEAHKGQTYSTEALRKMGQAQRGKPKSEEHRRKLSEAQKGRPKPRQPPY